MKDMLRAAWEEHRACIVVSVALAGALVGGLLYAKASAPKSETETRIQR